MSEQAGSKKKQKISASVAQSVSIAKSVAPVAKAAVNCTWSAWKGNQSIGLKVVINHIKYGGTRGEKKPSWMLLTPIGDVETRRYTCWERSFLEKMELSIGAVCAISAYANITAFVPNYSLPYKIIGKNVAISNKSEIMIGGTPVPLLTAPLIHQNASVGRLSGVVEVVTQPLMTITKSMYKDHENDDVAKLPFPYRIDHT
jgi:hypothetical protein